MHSSLFFEFRRIKLYAAKIRGSPPGSRLFYVGHCFLALFRASLTCAVIAAQFLDAI